MRRTTNGGQGVVAAGVTRAVFLILALASLWFAERGREAFSQYSVDSYSVDRARFHLGLWAAWIGLGVLSGALLGLALWLPSRVANYRWGQVLLLGLPILLLLASATIWFLSLNSGQVPPGLYIDFYFLTPFSQPGPQSVLAVMLGIVLVSGPRPQPADGQQKRQDAGVSAD
jgi:hypothetical protein